MASRRKEIAAIIALAASVCSLTADRIVAASPGERTISFLHIHTKETLTVTYKRDGKYVPEALKQISWIMRDWRKNQATTMDPETIDLIYEMHAELGSQQPVNIICGYRSRDTNEMLRRTVGGQASQSQHITGKAIDVTFPDVPLKRMRYSALIRERGGVGYYPTSGIPFVHVDTARVRAWPRLPRYELALLFPNGRTKHLPAEGGPISPEDVRVARSKYHDLAVQIAQFHDDRKSGKSAILLASAEPADAHTHAAGEASENERALQAAADEKPKRSFAVASLTEMLPWSRKKGDDKPAKAVTFEPIPPAPVPPAKPAPVAALEPESKASSPKLVTTPKLIDRSSRFTPPANDKSKLAAMIAKAMSEPMPKLVAEPKPAERPSKALAEAAMPKEPPSAASTGPKVAALIPAKDEAGSITDMSPDSLGNGWAQAPEFDEDHPEELAYRPFPLAPMLTESPVPNADAYGGLQHPDVALTLETLDDEGAVQPMRFRPGQQVAQAMWAQQFEGKAVHVEALEELDRAPRLTGIENRQVQTSKR